MSPSWETTQERLVEVLAERTRSTHARRRARLDRELAALADELGLDLDELDGLDGLEAEQVGAVPATSGLEGSFRITRGARDVMPFYIGLLLAPIIAGLGAPAAGVALAAAVVMAAIVNHRRRLSRFAIDALGRLDIRRVGIVDWNDVDEVSFRLRYPWMESRRPGMATGVTAEVRIHRAHGRALRLAQGQLFQTRPQRRSVSSDKLSRYLRRQATAAGLTAERLPAKQGGWKASRPAGQRRPEV